MRTKCFSVLASAAVLATLQPEPGFAANACPAIPGMHAPWVAVISAERPLVVHAKVRGDYDPGSGELMAGRGAAAASKWIQGGLRLGGATGVPIVGALVLHAFVATAPVALIAGAIDGAAEAATYSNRHEAVARRVEQALREEAVGARLAHSMAGTLGRAASAPVQLVDGGRFDASTLLARCGAVVALEIQFERIEFEAPSVIEFVGRPRVVVGYRLIHAGSSAPVDGTAHFTGRYHKFLSIEEEGAGALRTEFVAGMDALSSRIHAALPSTVAWTRPDSRLASMPVQVSTIAENLREPLRVHPDLIQPPRPNHLAAM
jgi:hypothetical protein